MWYTWTSVNDFNAWHAAVCLKLGFPRVGFNGATGIADESAQWTIRYADPIRLADDDIRCFITDFYDDAESFGAVQCDQPSLQEIMPGGNNGN